MTTVLIVMSEIIKITCPFILLHFAGREEVVTLLINEFGCDVKDTGYNGRPVLHRLQRACESGNSSLVRTLINDYSADRNVRDDDNNLPIHIAAFCGREEVVTLLINEFGCDVKDTGYKVDQFFTMGM